MPTHLANEAVLVGEAQGGNGQAFATLVNQYAPNIYRLALNITRNTAHAEDVLQETFLKAYSKLHQFRGNSKFYTWLVRIAVNEALLKLRQRNHDRWSSLDEPGGNEADQALPHEVVDWAENPEERYHQAELREILQREMVQLEPAYRIVVVLRDIEELSTQETAEALKLSLPDVKSRLLRGRLQLREQLNKYFRQDMRVRSEARRAASTTEGIQ